MQILQNNCSMFYAKYQNMLDPQISWDLANEIDDFSENDFPKVRKKLEDIRKES